ncbi:sugar phosphate isomerase/epimerase family protein [Aureimonas pseudogalii]|uniref:Sugar phosphate isomerase/epimerase n=1 Tax=Aureimonas pseudogalii TaxID=1744844 RepID=A0A7W6H7T2_9HYPH|nr:TIM barrel protein [Aureimonas pseudogalii]MBB4000188.1 sugar phosphate isomerase/epimerase [Aureimonas pseudogalii]
MTRKLALSFLTCLGAAPEEAVRAAAAAGYDHVGLRMLPAAPNGLAFPLMDDPGRVRDLAALMKDEGISVFDMEIVRIGPTFEVEPLRPFLDCTARLGAKTILVAGDDPDEARLTASYVAFCEAAARFGLTADLEFMPQSDLRDLAAALRVLRAAGQPNQGVIVDALHVSRAGVSPAEIAAIPPQWLHYAQICDAPAAVPTGRDALNFTARHDRLLPGEGGIDLAAIFAALPSDLPVAVEIPNDRQSAGHSPAQWAKRARDASLAVLSEKRAERVA